MLSRRRYRILEVSKNPISEPSIQGVQGTRVSYTNPLRLSVL
jgi:hypothetical protein